MRNSLARVHLFVSGSVQGVFFRQNTCKKAISLNLTGYVKNLEDGRVEIVAQGRKKDVWMLIEFCKNGHVLAKVVDLEMKYEPPGSEFKVFEVR